MTNFGMYQICVDKKQIKISCQFVSSKMNKRYKCIEIFEGSCKMIYVSYNNSFSCAKQTYVVQKHTKISYPLSYFYGSYSLKRILNK